MNGPQKTRGTAEPKPNGRLRIRTGIFLVILSGVFWFSIFAVPFTSLSTSHKALLAGILFGAVQISWWSGAALLGPTAIASIKARLTRKQ